MRCTFGGGWAPVPVPGGVPTNGPDGKYSCTPPLSGSSCTPPPSKSDNSDPASASVSPPIPPSKSNIDPGGEVGRLEKNEPVGLILVGGLLVDHSEGRSNPTDEGPPKGPVVPVPPKPCNKEAKSSCVIESRTRSSLSQGL